MDRPRFLVVPALLCVVYSVYPIQHGKYGDMRIKHLEEMGNRRKVLLPVKDISPDSNVAKPCPLQDNMYVDCTQGHGCPQHCCCNSTLKIVHCANEGLQSFPKDVPSDTKSLILSHNRLTRLDNNTFDGLPDLELLYLDGNNISHIEVNTFQNISKLCLINLSRNNLTKDILEKSVFCGIPLSLRSLNVSRSTDPFYYYSLSKASLNCMKKVHLHTVDFSYNRYLCQMHNHTFSGMKSLMVAYFTLMECSHFNVFALEGLPNLVELHLSRNELDQIPNFAADSMGKPILPRLRYLFLDYNKISELTANGTMGLRGIKHLHLQHNDIKFFNDFVIQNLTNLHKLGLNDNRIQIIDPQALKSDSLREIRLYRNPMDVEKLPADLFRYAPQIKEIYLGGFFGSNYSIMEQMLQNISTLDTLVLESFQRMMEIPPNIFRGLYNLTTLSLANNILREIDGAVFQDINSLHTLNIQSNLITVLNSSHIPRKLLKSLKEVDLSLNPWDCTCDLFWLVDLIQQDKHIKFLNSDDIVCASPASMHVGVNHLKDIPLTPDKCLTKPMSAHMISSIVLACLIAMISLIYSAVERYKWYLKRQLYYFSLRCMPKDETERSEDDQRFHFDAFVSHDSADIQWVKVLMTELERRTVPALKVCVSDKHWYIGHDKVDCIEESLDICRKIILVVTNAYARNNWNLLELTMAQHNLFENDCDNVILAIMEDIDPLNMYPRLALEMKRKPYLEWTDDVNGQQLFWEKLKQMVKSPNARVRKEIPAPDEVIFHDI